MGREEIETIAPAIAELAAEGLDVVGPLPADTMFHPAARARYDVALTMYHDQGLIPAKTLAFDDGVNVTLGLPFVRTSPDHGTAFRHRGQGIGQSLEPDRGDAAGRAALRMTLADDGLPPLREVVAAHGLDAKKSLGQNFLFDLNLTRRIARAAGPLSGVVVVEVGPGPGGLTRALLAEGAKKVISIERDERCLPRSRRSPHAGRGGWKYCRATRSKSTPILWSRGPKARRCASAPTCPTTSRRPC